MSKATEDRNKLVQNELNEVLKEKFIQDLGSKATVDRSEIQNEYLDQLRSVLAELGTDMETTGIVPKGMTYVGSLSVHVYKSHVLNTAVFATLSNMGNLTPDLADGALRELTGNTMAVYGKARQKLKSGF